MPHASVPVRVRIVLCFLHLHQALYEATDGRAGHRLWGIPCLLLRTTGRRTGKHRTSALVYACDGEDYVVVGSLGGADRAPAWLHNVRACPHVWAQVQRHRFPAIAEVIEPGDDAYERLWRLVNQDNGGRYERYQARTRRPIPVVVLTPQG